MVAPFSFALPASAAPVVYEITGKWAAGTPAVTKAGDAVAAEWRINVNDGAPAPSNAPVDDVTLAVTLANGTFDALPEICKTVGVSPVSAISANRRTLTCNIGTRDQGSAVAITTPITATGLTGSELAATGSIAGQQVALAPIPVQNKFGMDIRWESVTSGINSNADSSDILFPWTIFHETGSSAGPNSVTYQVTLGNTLGATMTNLGCEALASAADGHPYSDNNHAADRTTAFPGTCTLTGTGATRTLTISGLNALYNPSNPPTKDSTGNALPASVQAIAAGAIRIRIEDARSGSASLSVAPVTYTSVNAETSVDAVANNTANKAWTRGVWSHGWRPAYTGQTADVWTDTYRVPAGTQVRQNIRLAPGAMSDPNNDNAGMCLILDGQYVSFDNAFLTDTADGTTAVSPATTTWYYRASSPISNPNSFLCDAASGNWSSVAPSTAADKATIRAVRVTFPFSRYRGT